ncbi:MAG: FMN-binding protein, partial [Anaerovoracaceae bacterium]
MIKERNKIKKRIWSIITLIAVIFTMMSTAYLQAYGATEPLAPKEEAGKYATGTYYGGGRGFHSLVAITQLGFTGEIPFPGEDTIKVKVEIAEGEKGETQIKSIKVIEHRDDLKPYGSIAERILPHLIKDNGVAQAKAALERKDSADQRYDEVTGATWTAKGMVEAVENALKGAEEKKEGKEGSFAYMEVDASSTFKNQASFNSPISLEGLVVKKVYKDGTKAPKIIPYGQFEAEKISLSEKNNFVMEREGNQVQKTKRIFISTPEVNKTGVNVTAVSPTEKRHVKAFKLKFKDGKVKEINGSEEDFLYAVDVAKGDSAEIVEVTAVDNKNEEVKIENFTFDRGLREWTIQLKPLSGSTFYVFNAYRIKINDQNIDGNTVTRFELGTPPSVVDYAVGETISFKGMSVSFAKGTEKLKAYPDGDWLKKEKIIASIPEGTTLTKEHIGKQKVTLTLDESVKSANGARQISFDIEVRDESAKTDGPQSVAFVGKNAQGTPFELGRITVTPGQTVYPKAGWLVNAATRNFDQIEMIVYDKNGKIVPQQTKGTESKPRVTQYKKGGLSKIYFGKVYEGFGETESRQSYLFLNMSAPPLPNQVAYFDLGDPKTADDDQEVAKTDFKQGATSAEVIIPEKYKSAKLTPKLFYVNEKERVEIPLNLGGTKVMPMAQGVIKDTLVIQGTGQEGGHEDFYSQWPSGKFFVIKKL